MESIFVKTIAVITSCETIEQLNIAENFMIKALKYSAKGWASIDYFTYAKYIEYKRKELIN